MASTTALSISKLKPRDKPYKEKVATGLMVRVAMNGMKYWIVQYCLEGKQHNYTLPEFYGPQTDAGHLSLADAKEKAAAIRATARKGIDPRKPQETSDDAGKLDVLNLYNAWFASLSRKDGGKELARSFSRDVLPELGSRKLSSLVEGDIAALLLKMAKAGKNRTATVTLNNLKQMFRWAEGRRPYKLVLDNPVINLKNTHVTAKGYEPIERDRALSEDEIRQICKGMKGALLMRPVEVAFWVTLSCCTRIGETVKTKWEHLDLDQGVWNIPRENTKTDKAHTVYLSPFTIRQFQRLEKTSEYCFPNQQGTSHISPQAPNDQIQRRQSGNTAISHTLVVSGGPFVIHDLRRSGATLMQKLGVQRHIIEHVLNHAESDKLVRIYQTHDYKEDQKEAWAKLGGLLDSIWSEAAV